MGASLASYHGVSYIRVLCFFVFLLEWGDLCNAPYYHGASGCHEELFYFKLLNLWFPTIVGWDRWQWNAVINRRAFNLILLDYKSNPLWAVDHSARMSTKSKAKFVKCCELQDALIIDFSNAHCGHIYYGHVWQRVGCTPIITFLVMDCRFCHDFRFSIFKEIYLWQPVKFDRAHFISVLWAQAFK